MRDVIDLKLPPIVKAPTSKGSDEKPFDVARSSAAARLGRSLTFIGLILYYLFYYVKLFFSDHSPSAGT
jgi:hypothetical protein